MEQKLTIDQLELVKRTQKEAIEATRDAQILTNFAKVKQQSLDDALTLLCGFYGFDKNKAQFNVETGTLIQDDKS